MITISGVDVGRNNGGCPTLYDIGYSLIQIPRFAGHTVRKWSVLHHLYAIYFYGRKKGADIKLQLYLLLHDAHEAITSDIPQPWKSDGMRVLQKELDIRIYTSVGLSQPALSTERIVHQMDNQMVYSEAKIFAPQVAEAIRKPGDNFRDGINVLDECADKSVVEAEDWLSGFTPPDAGQEFLQTVTSLKGKL
jgi:hypothetical protein